MGVHLNDSQVSHANLPVECCLQLTFRTKEVFTKVDLKKLEEYKQVARKIGEQEKGEGFCLHGLPGP